MLRGELDAADECPVTSIVAGTSYGYQADSAQTGTGGTPQYQFNWGDGTNTGWLPVGNTWANASHTWSAAGTYTVTAQAQDPSDNVAIATSNGFTVTVAPLVPITIATYPVNLSYTVDGTGYSSPHTFQWAPGTQHSLTAATQNNGNGTQYAFTGWPDGNTTGADTITVPNTAATWTASFTVQYYLTTSAAPAGEGSVSPASGWYNSGQVGSVIGSASTGYAFTGFSGALSGGATPQNLTMTAPASVAANFTTLTLITPNPPPLVLTSGQPTLATYSFSSGNGNWLSGGGGCTSADHNLSAQIAPAGPSWVGLHVAASAAETNTSGTIDCSWTCPGGGGGVVHLPVMISPSPVIWSVTDAAGDQPAALYAGGTATITIAGNNFGSAGGELYFCMAGANPCVLAANATPMSYNYTSTGCTTCSWTNNQIITTVTLPSTASTGPWQMFVISLAWLQASAWSNPSMGNLNVTIPPQVSGPIGVALNGSASFAVTITPGNMDPVTVTLSTPSGTGSATFADGTTSTTLYESQDLTVLGKVVSSTANNITISTSIDGNPFGSAQFSVVSVTISLNTTQGGQPGGQLAQDDTAAANYLPTVTSGGPLGQEINASVGGHVTCSIGVELAGTGTPSNYSGTITLQRNIVSGIAYQGSTFLQNFALSPDNSNLAFEVTTATALAGRIYDLDAPGVNATPPVFRVRYNFQEYAVLGVPAPPPNNPPQVGSNFAYYPRASCGTDVNGNPKFDTTIIGDNQAGTGTTPLTLTFQ